MWLDNLVKSTWQSALGGLFHELEKEKNKTKPTHTKPTQINPPSLYLKTKEVQDPLLIASVCLSALTLENTCLKVF